MADPSRIVDQRVYACELQPSVDFAQLLQEARTRWLRPAEICEILRNYRLFRLTPDPPFKPIGGSMFLYDRNTLRYFRRDGHRWRKKRDGKTVREAHEKLKVGSIDVLHCYYAHGENNELFQRRSYWMLHENTKIVLVHYRDVPPNNKSSTQVSPTEEKIHDLNEHTGPSLQYGHVQINPNSFASQYSSSGSSQGVPSGNSGFYCTPLSDENSFMIPKLNESSIAPQNFYSGSLSPNYSPLQELNRDFGPQNTASIIPQPLTMANEAALLDIEAFLESSSSEFELEMSQPIQGQNGHDEIEAFLETSSSEFNLETSQPIQGQNSHDLKDLGRIEPWTYTEGSEDSHMEAVSPWGDYSNAPLEVTNHQEETMEEMTCPFSQIRQLNSDVGPLISDEQLFAIIDFSPDWAYSNSATKVLISVKFLGGFDPRTIKWSCMFGETEVEAEVLTLSGGALRCMAPPLTEMGWVPFYITKSDRIACSEIREFEYRPVPSPRSQPPEPNSHEEYLLQVRLAKLLSANKDLICLVQSCEKCEIMRRMSRGLAGGQSRDGQSHTGATEGLLVRMMKGKLCEWLGWRLHEEEKSRKRNVLDREGQGVIHLVAALDYDWAVGPVVASGISPNFRDVRGQTALHWAAYYGREEMVVALLKLGADPRLVEDPTSKSPIGCTAADVASFRGYKGIAGFLAEAHLTSHLSSLTINQESISKILACFANEDDGIIVQGDEDDDVALNATILEALRNSSLAAARIQAALRVSSFRQRQNRERGMREKEDGGNEVIDDVALVCSSSSRSIHRPKVNTPYYGGKSFIAALKIQQKYRGYKGRNDYSETRDKIVKLQARVRGHQVRKQYNKVVQKALTRVRSMSRSSEARRQYMRLVLSSRQSCK